MLRSQQALEEFFLAFSSDPSLNPEDACVDELTILLMVVLQFVQTFLTHKIGHIQIV